MKKCRLILTSLALVVVCFALLVGSAFFWWTNIYLPRLRHKAEARWAAIGRPMPEFEKRLNRTEENDSLRALTADLQPFGIRTFYKARNGEESPNTIRIPREVTDVLNPEISRTDDQVQAFTRPLPYLDEHSDDLDRLYRGILQREPAIWSFVPQDGMTLRVASFLAARSMSQLICVDALRKIEKGDEKGACDAIQAGLKMTSNIGEQPILVSQMIRVAIEGLFTQVIARLPEDPDALRRLATEVGKKRERWREAIQTETWAVARFSDYLGFSREAFQTTYRGKPFTRKIQISYDRSLLQGDCCFFLMGGAEQVRISERVSELAKRDLGVRKMREAGSDCAPILTTANLPSLSGAFRQNWFGSWIRLNAVLLLREQVELIRWSRAKVQAGASGWLGELESVVIPGAKWKITGDTNTNSACLTLKPVPPWTSDDQAIGKHFFLLPLDGSKSWTFRTRQMQSRAEDLVSK
jgi:hypothetical protein